MLDIDRKNGADGEQSLRDAGFDLPVTRIGHTPSAGFHFLFQHPGSSIRNAVGILPGVDIRGDGGYIVAPPSTIGSNAYHWEDESEVIAPSPGLLFPLMLNGRTLAPAQIAPGV